MAVAVHTRMVSMNTDSICTRPCLTGWETSAAAAAFGAEPTPASLEYRPRLMPCMRADEPKPAAPPKIALKSNAPAKMRRSTSGSMPALSTMTMSAMMMYSTPMTGTSTPVTLTMRLPLPKMQMPTRSASSAPPMIGRRCAPEAVTSVS